MNQITLPFTTSHSAPKKKKLPFTNYGILLTYNFIRDNSHWPIDLAKSYCLREYKQFNVDSKVFSDALKHYISSN